MRSKRRPKRKEMPRTRRSNLLKLS
jgi:hypothetical protein